MSTRETVATWQFDHDLWDETRILLERSVHAGHIRGHSTVGKSQVRFHWVQTCRRRHGQKLDIKLAACAGRISSAFPSPAVRELYIILPEEDATPGMVGQLLRPLNETRDAAHEWDDFANKKIAAVRYQVGVSSPCIHVNNAEP